MHSDLRVVHCSGVTPCPLHSHWRTLSECLSITRDICDLSLFVCWQSMTSSDTRLKTAHKTVVNFRIRDIFQYTVYSRDSCRFSQILFKFNEIFYYISLSVSILFRLLISDSELKCVFQSYVVSLFIHIAWIFKKFCELLNTMFLFCKYWV